MFGLAGLLASSYGPVQYKVIHLKFETGVDYLYIVAGIGWRGPRGGKRINIVLTLMFVHLATLTLFLMVFKSSNDVCGLNHG